MNSNEPRFSLMTERMYSRLPQVLRETDAQNGYVLKMYLSAVGDVQDEVDRLIARFNYLPMDERDTTGFAPWTQYRTGFINEDGDYVDENGNTTASLINHYYNPVFGVVTDTSPAFTNHAYNPGPYTALENTQAAWDYVESGEEGITDFFDGRARRRVFTPKPSGSNGWTYTQQMAGAKNEIFTTSLELEPPNDLNVRVRITFRMGSTVVNSQDSETTFLPRNRVTRVSVNGKAEGQFDNIVIWAYHLGVANILDVPDIGDYYAGRMIIQKGVTKFSPPLVNLSTNPSFEKTSGTIEFRRNRFPAPVDGGNSAWWSTGFGTGGDGTNGGETGAGQGGTVAFTTIWTVAPTAGGSSASAGRPTGSGNAAAVTPGEVVSGSLTVEVSQAIAVRPRILFYDDAGAAVGSRDGADVLVPANVPTRLTLDGTTVSVGATRAILEARIQNLAGVPVGFRRRVSNALIEVASNTGPFFAPGFPSPDPDLAPSWTGTPNASESALRGTGIAGGGLLKSRASIASTQWKKSGTKSVRIIPGTATNDTFASPEGDSGGMRLGMEAGKTYTVSATMRLAAPQQGELHARARSISVFYRVGTGPHLGMSSNPAPNVAGEHEVRYIFTVPEGSTEVFVRLYNGASVGNGDVWWDDFFVTPGEYTGLPFNGHTVNQLPVFYEWEGDVDASRSFAYPIYIPVGRGYFDGYETFDPDAIPDWVGEDGNSASVMLKRNLASVLPDNPGRAIVGQSSIWGSAGEHSLRIISMDTKGESYASLEVPFQPSSNTAGATHTFLARVHYKTPMTAPSARALKPLIVMDGKIVPVTYSSTAEGFPGTYTVRGTFVFPPDAVSWDDFRLYNGDVMGGADVWWSDVLIIRGGYMGGFFYGGSKSTAGVRHQWFGDEGYSESIQYNTGVQDAPGVIEARPLGKTLGTTSDLVDAETADPEWFLWLAQLSGIDPTKINPTEASRPRLTSGSSGFRAGSRSAISGVLKPFLSGDQYLAIIPSTKSDMRIGEGTAWDLLIITRTTETPANFDPEAILVAAGVKPAGVTVHHRGYEASWDTLETLRPRWVDWEVTWTELEETGASVIG